MGENGILLHPVTLQCRKLTHTNIPHSIKTCSTDMANSLHMQPQIITPCDVHRWIIDFQTHQRPVRLFRIDLGNAMIQNHHEALTLKVTIDTPPLLSPQADLESRHQPLITTASVCQSTRRMHHQMASSLLPLRHSRYPRETRCVCPHKIASQ
jgi:hypothetical protein